MSFLDLKCFAERVQDELPCSEKLRGNISKFCSGYPDRAGRIAFVLHVQENYLIDIPRLASRFGFFTPKKLQREKRFSFGMPVSAESKPPEVTALTDDLEVISEQLRITNPRWQHADESKKQSSPQTACVGDKLTLMVDIQAYPNDAVVTFDIWDASEEPAFRIDTVRGKNEKGVGKATWVAADPNDHGEALKIQFEGSARSKVSGRAEIAVEAVMVYTFSL